MPLMAEPAADATPAATTAGQPANDALLGRTERGNAPSGRARGNPLRQRRVGSPVSAGSSARAMCERDVLQTVLMASADGQSTMRSEEDTLQNI
eukprot:6469588-Pyramimonas_sp.AAC.1